MVLSRGDNRGIGVDGTSETMAPDFTHSVDLRF